MDNSVLLAKFVGPFIVLIGIGLLLNTKAYLQIMKDFLKDTALIYITGLITFTAGLSIVLFHNMWVKDWRVLITIFGWISLIKGVWLTILPGAALKIAKKFSKNIKFAMIPWSLMLIIGIFLIVKGYK